MPYEIPQSLQYQEKIVFNLTLFQVACLTLAVIPIGLLWFKINTAEWIKWILTVILAILGISFSFFDLAQWIKKIQTYRHENQQLMRNEKSFQTNLIQKIEQDCVFLRQGSLRAVLKVKPIEFYWLSEHEQSAIIAGFREFIQSIDFPIQLCMRTTDWNEQAYLQTIQNQSNNEVKQNYLQHFKRFITELKDSRRIKQRFFYLVIPSSKINSPTDLLFSSFSKQEVEQHEEIDRLTNRCNWCQQKLESFGIQSRRLTTSELSNEMNHYFSGGG